jgi:cytochrome c oxidase subunit IV
MDISKLPKLSDTKSQTPPASPPEPVEESRPAPIDYANNPRYQPSGIGADIWISLCIGILLCYLGGTFGSFAIAKITHHPFHTGVNWTTGPKNGAEVDYFDLEGFTAWSDMGVFLFGLILLFDAAAKTVSVLRPGKPARFALMVAIFLTVLGILLNMIACAKLFSVSITPLLSGFAVAFGGWILIDHWNALKRAR